MAKDKKSKREKKGRKTSESKGALKSLVDNPFVADVVAAALVATASALKDSKRARALAADAGDELTKLSQGSAKRGNAMWAMALEIGKRSLAALENEPGAKSKSKGKGKGKGKGKIKQAAETPAKRAAKSS